MKNVQLLWAIAKDFNSSKLRFKVASRDENAKAEILGSIVAAVELSKSFGGKESEDLSFNELEKIFENPNIPFMQAIIMKKAPIVAYFGIEFSSIENRDRFIDMFSKLSN